MITLRKMTEKDLPFLLEIRNDYSTRKWLANDEVFTLEQCSEWFKNLKNDWYIIEYCIDISSNKGFWNTIISALNNLFGGIKVGYVRTSDETEEQIIIGCDIHPSYRGKGFATEALQQTIEMYKNKNIYLWVFLKNKIAIKLYYKLGFNFTGDFTRVREQMYMEMKLER